MSYLKKIIVCVLFCFGFISLLIGSFAYYRVIVSGSISGSTGNAVFVLRDTIDGESWNNKVINFGKINPGDSGSFDVVMDASGSSVDMYATLNIERNNLPSNLKFYTTPDHKSELHKYYSFLEKNKTNKEKLTVYWYWNPYIDNEEDNKYVNKSFSANITVNAVQISEYATMKNGYSVKTEFWNNNYTPYIRTITFGNDLSNLPSSCTEDNLCWDISESQTQNKKVYGYLVDTGLKDSTDNTKPLYNLYIVSEAPIFAPSNCGYIFSFFKYDDNNYKFVSNLIQVKFNNNFNTSNVTDMGGMFAECSSLTSLDLSSFNTLNVTDMESMFYLCSSLTSLDLSSFNTANVPTMSQIFKNCESLTNLDLSSFNTVNMTSMYWMFCGCSSITGLDLSSFNTANVTNMSGMFISCQSLTSLNLSSFNTAKVTNMSSMFNICSSLTSLDLSNFNTANVTDMSGMFDHCSSLEKLNLSNFNTSKVEIYNKNGYSIFQGCTKLQTEITIMNPNVTEKNYENMFYGAATDPNAKIIVNYTSETETLVDNMIKIKTANSNVIKGIQV